MPDRDTVMRHDETRKLKSEPRQDKQMPRLSQDRDKNHVSRQDTCFKTLSLITRRPVVFEKCNPASQYKSTTMSKITIEVQIST